MKRAIDRPDDPKPSGITLRHSQRPFAYERLDLFVYHDESMSFLVSPTSILPISSSSLLHDSFSFVLFFSFKNSRCDTQREEPWEKFMWLAQTRPEFDSGTYCSFQLYGTPRSIAYRL